MPLSQAGLNDLANQMNEDGVDFLDEGGLGRGHGNRHV
jgi:hypothetical protein